MLLFVGGYYREYNNLLYFRVFDQHSTLPMHTHKLIHTYMCVIGTADVYQCVSLYQSMCKRVPAQGVNPVLEQISTRNNT